MSTTKFELAPYSAYLNRPQPQEPNELMQVGPGTPCGEYFRRSWQPVAYSEELKDLPKKVRILGEDLVIFRDKSGRVGALQPRCSHRGTSLEYGVIAERGIRCCYHGWHYDIDGRILDIPGQPPAAAEAIKSKLSQGAYPTHEFGGLVFLYMGPPDKRPPFVELDTWKIPGTKMIPGARDDFPCNWLQVRENNQDPAHTAYLHTIITGAQFSPEFGVLPELSWVETAVGMAYLATRRIGDLVWVRMVELILPNINQTGPAMATPKTEQLRIPPILTTWIVPIDDTHTMRMGFRIINESVAGADLKSIAASTEFGNKERPYEESQRVPGDYEAIVGQGVMTDHSQEHLIASDRGVMMYRKLIKQGIQATQRGEDFKGWQHNGHGASADPLRTFAQDSFIHAPAAESEEAEKALMRRLSADVAAGKYR